MLFDEAAVCLDNNNGSPPHSNNGESIVNLQQQSSFNGVVDKRGTSATKNSMVNHNNMKLRDPNSSLKKMRSFKDDQ